LEPLFYVLHQQTNNPQLIREKVERLFEKGFIDYLFSTSTLLEGVNLPAKNIFILSKLHQSFVLISNPSHLLSCK
jgi:superfamily II DNA or RNA helicase